MKTKKIQVIADRYAKVVEWSVEDGCFVGRIPALGYGGAPALRAKGPSRMFGTGRATGAQRRAPALPNIVSEDFLPRQDV